MTCESGKQCFQTYNQAKRSLRFADRRSDRKLEAYRCTLCGFWHFSGYGKRR